ncbi:TRAP transporter small permease [Cohnella massiliensis]|uniref:TRAP transporter small permease n=1 Tax=Cohnella massiliensis TaxID=1816691 RepID=UPI0009BB5F78|nr:TRAP transporter small permease [Cohnella massiliensis]
MEQEKKKSNHPVDKLLDACLVLVNILLALLIVIVVADVVMTYFFDTPLKWSIEVSEYALGFVAFLGAGWLMREEGHLRFGMVLDRLPPRLRSALEAFVSIVCFAVSAAIVWAGVAICLSLYERGALMESVLQWPRWALIAAVPLGFAIMALQLVRRAARHLKECLAIRSRS